MNLIYVIGYPGSGKTTAVRAALTQLGRAAEPRDHPIPHVRRGDVWHLGRELDGPFAGTDKLAMNIQPAAIAWLNDPAALTGCRTLIAEGDRLANPSFFAAARQAGHHLLIALIDTPLHDARRRADHRAVTHNMPAQSATWWKGRVTKTNNLANSRPVLHLNPEHAAHTLHQLLTPANK